MMAVEGKFTVSRSFRPTSDREIALFIFTCLRISPVFESHCQIHNRFSTGAYLQLIMVDQTGHPSKTAFVYFKLTNRKQHQQKRNTFAGTDAPPGVCAVI